MLPQTEHLFYGGKVPFALPNTARPYLMITARVGLLVVLVNIGCVALAFVGQLFGVHAAFYEEVVNALGAVLGNALVACRRTRLLSAWPSIL